MIKTVAQKGVKNHYFKTNMPVTGCITIVEGRCKNTRLPLIVIPNRGFFEYIILCSAKERYDFRVLFNHSTCSSGFAVLGNIIANETLH